MNEDKILSQIQNECSGLASDSFDKICRDISEESESLRAEIIYRDSKKGFVFLKCAAAAAAVILPAVITLNMYSGRVRSENKPETENFSVSQTVQQTVYSTSSCTEAALTSASAYETENSSVTEISASVTESPVTVFSYAAVSDYNQYTGQSENEIIKTESAEKSEKTPDETASSESVPEITSAPEVTDEPVTAVIPESFKTDFRLVPGYRDKIFCLEFNADRTDNRSKVFSDGELSCTVESPDAYTVFVYDIIVYDYDYFDFLSKGDFLFKTEKKYTLDEILSAEEKILTLEDLVSAGLAAEER